GEITPIHSEHPPISTAIPFIPSVWDAFQPLDWFGALHVATYYNFTFIIPNLLDRDPSQVNAQSWRGSTPLLLEGHASVMVALLARPLIEANTTNLGDHTPLIAATVNGHVIRLSLAHPSVDANVGSIIIKRTASMHAFMYRSNDALSSLLQHPGIDVNFRDDEGRTPLIAAAKLRNEYAVSHLLVHSTLDLNARGSIKGRTAWMWVTSLGHHWVGSVGHALGPCRHRPKRSGHQGADSPDAGHHPTFCINLNRSSGDRRQPKRLHRSYSADPRSYRGSKCPSWKYFFRQDGLDVNAVDESEHTALTIAARYGLEAVISSVSQHPTTDVNCTGPQEAPTLLHAKFYTG
ncbi:ankyrin repeat-containing domain protein, partial [Coprinopsis sp. MPI-PUGE-AT-0042]